MKKTLLFCLFAVAFATGKAQIDDTLRYFTNKQLYLAPSYTAHPFYGEQAALINYTTATSVTHVGSIFRNKTTISVKGLEARVLKDPFNPSLNGVATRMYLCTLGVGGMPVLPGLDSITTNATNSAAHQYGETIGGTFTAAVTVTNDFAVLIRNISGTAGDVLKVFRTAGHTATSTAAPGASYKFGEGLGVFRIGGQFVKTIDYPNADFGVGTDYEFCVAPVVQFSLEVNQLESPTQSGACCWEVFTNTNTSTPAFTNRQFNFNEFYRQWKPFPFNPATMPSLQTDSVLTWNLGDGSVFSIPPRWDTVHLYFGSGNCNQFYNGSLTGNYRKMASLSSPTYSAGLTFTSSTVYCGNDTLGSGIHNMDALAGVSVFPNPAAEQVVVSGLKGTSTIGVYNLFGQVVLTRVTEKETLQLDLQHLPAGNYLLRITDKEGRSRTIKTVRLSGQ